MNCSHYDILNKQLQALERVRQETLSKLIREIWENMFKEPKPVKRKRRNK